MTDRNAAAAPPLLLGLTGLGLLGMIATFFVDGGMRFAANWIMWYMAGVAVLLGALFLITIEHLVGARWSIPLRRVAERVTSLIGPLFLAGVVAAAIGMGFFYEWGTPEFMEMAATDHHLHAKYIWFHPAFFYGRLVFCFLIWGLAYRKFTKASVGQDESKDVAVSLKARRFSAPFIILFAITTSIAAFDFLMSVEPRWYSTIFGVYFFAVAVLTGLSVITLVTIRLIRMGRLPQVRDDHVYSLGGLLFAFTVFWTYISFSQFMLYWYGNLPFEIFWYIDRLEGGWKPLTYALSIARFAVPFFALLSREAKTDLGRLSWVAKWIIATTILDLYWVIFPSFGRMSGGSGLVFNWQEVSFALFFIGAAMIWLRRSQSMGADMPVGDPRLKRGLEFHL